METPFFTVVIPTFNRERELPRTIDSVLNQTEKEWELLIIDDGSTDQTEASIKQYLVADKIHFHHRPKGLPKGANSCRNFGMNKASGKYIALLDSDDEWTKNKLTNDRKYFQSNPSCFGLHSGTFHDNGSRRVTNPARDLRSNETYVDYIFSDDVLAQTSTFVFEKNAGCLIRFDENLQRHQDMDFFIRFGKKYGWKFRTSKDTIIHWEQNVSRTMHFASMIIFYKKYSSEVTRPKWKGRYLTWAWVNAKKRKDSSKKFFLSELRSIKKLPIKYLVFRLTPNILYSCWIVIKTTDKILKRLTLIFVRP